MSATICALLIAGAAAFQPTGLNLPGVPSVAATESVRISVASCSAVGQRRSFLLGAAAALSTGLSVLPASAADKGKAYNDCISKCVYESTKIAKGIAQVEYKPREEAMAECKPKCLPLAVKK